jgi:hypothetical protein
MVEREGRVIEHDLDRLLRSEKMVARERGVTEHG